MDRIISRSGYECFTACPRAYYYEYALDGTGYRPTENVPWALHVGTAIHAGMEVFMKEKLGPRTFDAVEAGLECFQYLIPGEHKANSLYTENHYLIRGLLTGWGEVKQENFLDRYEVLCVEKEVRVPLSSNVYLAARADAVVRDRENGICHVINWKTSSKGAKNWTSNWQYEIQMWTEAVAMEEEFPNISGVIVVGLLKGTARDGDRYSPFTRAKRNKETQELSFSNPQGKAWDIVHPWDECYDWNEWYDMIPRDILMAQYVESQPIFKNNLVVEKWLRQVVRRETDAQYVLEHGSPEEQEDFFYQNFTEKCKWCPFREICMGSTTMKTLIEDGFMERRVDHHANA